uniref:uncharacterized protein LOC118521299 isoform X2 n=1 Tax=Halichoerus grypus TaxID=9711 RepID=UPI0016598027|nr:uncharacterized protein LOC118521299 isoform X2 [Halichoerus grypus]
MSPCGPRGVALAGLRAERGCRGSARRPRGKVGGARQALVPAAPAGSAAARGTPPAPGLHARERLEEPAREPTASASPAQRLGRRSPRSGDNCEVGLLGPAPSLARPPPAAAERVASPCFYMRAHRLQVDSHGLFKRMFDHAAQAYTGEDSGICAVAGSPSMPLLEALTLWGELSPAEKGAMSVGLLGSSRVEGGPAPSAGKAGATKTGRSCAGWTPPRGTVCSYKSSALGVKKLSTAGVVLDPAAGVYLRSTASTLQTLAVQWEKDKKGKK